MARAARGVFSQRVRGVDFDQLAEDVARELAFAEPKPDWAGAGARQGTRGERDPTQHGGYGSSDPRDGVHLTRAAWAAPRPG